jgi:hypothetical protein
MKDFGYRRISMNPTLACHRRYRGAVWMVFLLAGLFASFAPSAWSQEPSAGTGAPTSGRELSGIWDLPGAARNPAFVGVEGRGSSFLKRDEEPSMTPWGMEKFQQNRKGAGNPKGDKNRIIEASADPHVYCYPMGPSRTMSGPGHRTFEIVERGDVVYILFERDHWVRRIYMDGRGHPDGYPITWMGHTTGKWDGDTLVADTVYINPVSWVDNFGHPMSDQMHMMERIRRLDQKHLQIDTTFDDPKAYTKPWVEKKTFELMPPGYEIMENVECEESLGKIKEVSDEDVLYTH